MMTPDKTRIGKLGFTPPPPWKIRCSRRLRPVAGPQPPSRSLRIQMAAGPSLRQVAWKHGISRAIVEIAADRGHRPIGDRNPKVPDLGNGGGDGGLKG